MHTILMNKKQRKMIIFGYILYYLALLIAVVICMNTSLRGNLHMAPVAAFTCFLAPLVLKIFKMNSSFEIYLVNIIFAFIASILGSMLSFYAIPYFDKFLHFSSGLFLSMLGYMIYLYFKDGKEPHTSKEKFVALLFVHCFNMTVAVSWEFFEYACLIFLNNDAIHHYSSGVHDSMTDMLVAMLGGFIIIGFIFHYYQTKKKNFWIRLSEHFFDINS